MHCSHLPRYQMTLFGTRAFSALNLPCLPGLSLKGLTVVPAVLWTAWATFNSSRTVLLRSCSGSSISPVPSKN